MNDITPSSSAVRGLRTGTTWRHVRGRYSAAVSWMANAPATWMGIPTWARWFRRVAAVRGRGDLALIPPARRTGHD